MRVSFVSKERIEMRTKEAFFYRGMLFIVNLLVLLAIVLLFVFLTRQNRLPFLIILCILGVFLLCYDYFEVAYRLLPLGKYLSFLKKMSGAESQEVEGDVLLLHESVSSPYGVRFLPFLLKTSSTQEEYLLSLAEGVSLKVGQHLTFSSSDHYVVGLESAEEEVLPLGDKSTIRRHFRHQGWVYLLLSAAVSLSFVYGASIKLQPSSKEKLRLFFMVYASEESALRDYVFSKRDDTLLQVEVLTYSPEVSSRGVILSTAGLVDTDFLLLPSDVFSEEELALHVAPIDETILSAYLPSTYTPTYQQAYGKDYGLLVHKKEEKGSTYLDSFCTFDTSSSNVSSYALYFNLSSPNLGGLGTSQKADDHALKAVGALLEEKA